MTVFCGSAADAAKPKPLGSAVTLKVVDTFVIPRFQTVASAAHAQQQAWTAYCANGSDPQSLRQAYDTLSDAWADIEFIRIGPAAAELRVERLNYWLDRENAVGKAIDTLIAGDKDPDAAQIAAGSAGGQGLPVLERLLYPDSALSQVTRASRRCAIGLAVAQNIANLAEAIVAGWTGSAGARTAIAKNKGWGVAFYDASEASSVLLTDLVSGLEGLKDNKVAMLFHDTANAAAPRLAEDARSGRTLRDIQRNFDAIREALAFFMAKANRKQKSDLAGAFADADAKLKAIAASAGKDQDAQTAALQAALTSFTTLNQTAQAILPAVTGVQLGFNNLDGD
jgi:hypothetical protein